MFDYLERRQQSDMRKRNIIRFGVALAVGIVLFALSSLWYSGFCYRRSSHQLDLLRRHCQAYQQDHAGQLPPDLQALVSARQLEPELRSLIQAGQVSYTFANDHSFELSVDGCHSFTVPKGVY